MFIDIRANILVAFILQVWESASDSLITFNNPDLQADLACIVENDVLTHAITRQLNTCDNHVEVRYDSRVKDYIMPFKSSPENPSAGVKICLESGEKITTKLLVWNNIIIVHLGFISRHEFLCINRATIKLQNSA